MLLSLETKLKVRDRILANLLNLLHSPGIGDEYLDAVKVADAQIDGLRKTKEAA